MKDDTLSAIFCLVCCCFVLLVVDSLRQSALERDQIEAMQVQPFPPVRPEMQFPPSEPPKPAPVTPVIPADCHELLPMESTFHADEDR